MENNKTTVYQIFRVVLGAIYKLWYNPKISGKENIPTDGAIVVVGNHVHIMDQCNVIISTKRTLHYMAKKEYFDPQYKEGKHGWFFRSAGCIPVDRKIHDDSAKSAALDVLNNNHALGLFPEGTRNGLKEERAKELYEQYIENKTGFDEFYKLAKKNKTSQVNYLEELMNKKVITKDEFIDNICTADEFLQILVNDRRITKDEYYEHIFLPFKYGAVSMANKTNARIVPFVITGDYKFRSKNLKVVIGEPIDPEEDLEVANEQLRNTMISMYRECDEKEW